MVPPPEVLRLSVKLSITNVPVSERLRVSVSVSGFVAAVVSPLQPPKWTCLCGVAVNVTTVFGGSLGWIGFTLVEPSPTLLTLTEYGEVRRTDRFASIVRVTGGGVP